MKKSCYFCEEIRGKPSCTILNAQECITCKFFKDKKKYYRNSEGYLVKIKKEGK